MYVCGIEDAQYKDEKIHFWDDVYGFDMRFQVFISTPCHQSVRPYLFLIFGHSHSSHVSFLLLAACPVFCPRLDLASPCAKLHQEDGYL